MNNELPDILLLTVDCLRYDRCGFNGRSPSPTPILDKLASDGLVFESAYASGPWTTESFPGILAGRFSYNCSYSQKPALKALPSGSSTLASKLQSVGYDTIGVSSNVHVCRERNFNLGFDEFVNVLNKEGGDDESVTAGLISHVLSGFDVSLGDFLWRLKPYMQDQYSASGLFNPFLYPFIVYRLLQERSGWPHVPAESVVDRMLTEATDVSDDEPMFLWGHFMDLHAPLRLRTDRSVRSLDMPTGKVHQYRADAVRTCNIRSPLYEEMYERSLHYVDEQIGRLVETLESERSDSDTIIIVTADHGEAFTEHGIYGHASLGEEFIHGERKHYMYDELLHIPLLMNGGVESNRIQGDFSLAWTHELIADSLGVNRFGLPAESGVESHVNSDEVRKPVLADTLTTHGHSIVTRSGQWKHYASTCSGEIEAESYDLSNDPGETNPSRGTAAPEVLRELADRAFAAGGEKAEIDAGGVSNNTEEQLKQLGYKM